MSKAHDRLRSFGMSGLMITQELAVLEQRLGTDLGHTPRPVAQAAVASYPQFEVMITDSSPKVV